MNITIKDESATGKIFNNLSLNIANEATTLREIIRLRIYKEVEDYNKKEPEYFNGLVQPSNAEKTLNGYRLRIRKKIDPEEQYFIALDSFKKNGYFLLVNDQQCMDLDEIIYVNQSTTISFIKLTPLIGG